MTRAQSDLIDIVWDNLPRSPEDPENTELRRTGLGVKTKAELLTCLMEAMRIVEKEMTK